MKKLIGLILVGFAVFCATSCSATTTTEVIKKDAVESTAKIQTEATEVAFVGTAVVLDCYLVQTNHSVPTYKPIAVATTKPVVIAEIGTNLIRQGKHLPKRQSVNYRT